jgi:hypothetical protein
VRGKRQASEVKAAIRMIWAVHGHRPWARTRAKTHAANPAGNAVCGLELELEAAARFACMWGDDADERKFGHSAAIFSTRF